MKEAFVHPGPRVEISDSPIPKPGLHQVLIKIVYSGSNPKDWKVPEWFSYGTPANSGDDMSGVIHEVGEGVVEFKKGDRVAAMHQIMQPHGSFAEYGLSWDYTTFHLPQNTTFQEGAAIPLAALTAALGLFEQDSLGLPHVFAPAKAPIPLLIYGASTTCCSYAIQLARRANIHPIVCVAGRAQEHVEALIDRSKGDTIVNYRDGAVTEGVRAALKGARLRHAIDAIGEKDTFGIVCEALELGSTAVLTGAGDKDRPKPPKDIRASVSGVAAVHTDYRDFGLVYSRLFTKGLEEGWLKAQPQEVIAGGLGGVEQGLKQLKEGKASAVKYVFKIEDTEGAGRD